MTARHVLYIIWPVIATMALLVALAFAGGADWGNLREGPVVNQDCLMKALEAGTRTRPCITTENRIPDSALLVAIIAVKLLLVSIMLRRMIKWDWLTISLALMLLTFSAVWLYVLGSRLWPVFTGEHRTESQWIIRISVVFSATWAAIQLLRTPDPAIEGRRLARINRAEGRAEGIAIGHAQAEQEGKSP